MIAIFQNNNRLFDLEDALWVTLPVIPSIHPPPPSPWSHSCGACWSCWFSAWSQPTSWALAPSLGSSPLSCSTSLGDLLPWPSPVCSTGEGSLFWRSSSLHYWWVYAAGRHAVWAGWASNVMSMNLFLIPLKSGWNNSNSIKQLTRETYVRDRAAETEVNLKLRESKENHLFFLYVLHFHLSWLWFGFVQNDVFPFSPSHRKSVVRMFTSSSWLRLCSPSPSPGLDCQRQKVAHSMTSQRNSEERRASLCTIRPDSTPSTDQRYRLGPGVRTLRKNRCAMQYK